MSQYPWIKHLIIDKDPYFGFVHSLEQANLVKQMYETRTKSKFFTYKREKNFGTGQY